ncbi:fructokinase [Arcanobacterium wilhelmae]|uniref:Fructokinase n=1 Tax=Arcanobacterium wilhelmae TaxID=1803177 RepID=A0ABT9NC51_9ACTO|nr:PfkB family carbohydrate kinase [Arcanobacterium wilhelmae]MDP9801257.1 fructokinase [Arcanobacterium wilhelmae]WFN90603.1 PfkB family carbohydrate kinase [Arcanobacterium wilhelmae]
MSTFVIGESLVDVIHSPAGVTRHPGGSPFATAVGLALLGRRTQLLTRIGDDADGTLLRARLEESGVELVNGSVDNRPTSTAHATINERGAASYEFSLVSDFPMPPEDPALRAKIQEHAPRAVHVGSLGAHLEPGRQAVLEWLKLYAGRSTVTYDPNIRLNVMGSAHTVLAQIDEMMPYIDVVKASDEDIAALLGEISPAEAAKYFLNRGAKLAVITRGPEGVLLATSHESVALPAAMVEVVDTVGAGDAMTAALIDGLGRFSVLGGEETAHIADLSAPVLRSLGAYAAAAAGIAITRAGANPPTRAELQAESELYAR